MRKVFRIFKGNLKCPHSNIELVSPISLKVRHDFKTSYYNTYNPDKVLQQSRAGKLKK
jgi:hypothetical protein